MKNDTTKQEIETYETGLDNERGLGPITVYDPREESSGVQ